MDIREIRRQNLRKMSRLAGGVTSLAERLQRSQSHISHIIGPHPTKNIGNKLATRIERTFEKPHGWLDQAWPQIEEEAAIYALKNVRSYHVPLIPWADITAWLSHFEEPRLKNTYPNIVVSTHVGNGAFALRLETDSMQSESGMCFPYGAVIIADPDLEAKNGHFVVAKPDKDREEIVFKQLVVEGTTRHFKPLNTRYPIHTQTSPYWIIYGVVRLMLMEVNFD